jgi:hypothetical protein
MEENLEVGSLLTTTAASITASGMLILVLAGAPLDVGVTFAVAVAVILPVIKGATDLVSGRMPGAGTAETRAPTARRERMLTR